MRKERRKTMTIRRYNRVLWEGDPYIRIRKDTCSCINPCGMKRHTRGYTIYIGKFIYHIEFDKPKKCDAPF